jgi:hypothetical protein
VQVVASSKNTKNSYDQIKGITLRGTSFYAIPVEREVKRCQKSDCHNDLETKTSAERRTKWNMANSSRSLCGLIL